MRKLEELINEEDPAWPMVQEWIETANNKVEILAVDPEKAKDALFHTQVTTRSPMGAVIYMTGGMLIDDGWIRILGSGSPKLNRSLPDWNKGKAFEEFGDAVPFLIVADDALGGSFVLNGGGLGDDPGMIYYFAPDTLSYEPLDLSYSEFLTFCFDNDLDSFYKGFRWKDWRTEVSDMPGDKAFSFFPFLWTVQGKDIEKNSREPVPAEELYHLNLSFREKL
ncbi:Protein of unknown function DUF2625 [Pedobacter caeni]|uniref:DUF2625 domain-containing protein n=2 Tax=Pedobacter caeni TaxID=288992 RepID=A0A1M4UPR0_9SPHI|nr:Protein of unknown function DUF2625 [Pedobacter caeni]